jgi:membrane associated rhomboid family serine protease
MRNTLLARAATLGGATAAMWVVRVLDWLGPGSTSAAGHGIVPRTVYGLDGIAVAPLIHADFEHLVANTIPFVILGAIILFRGIDELLFVTLVSLLVAGFGTWLFGTTNSEHIGASGLVFGFFGYLVFRGVFDRRLSSLAIMLGVAFAYGASMAYALVPAEGISWAAHFFGFVGGFAAARIRYRRTANDDRVKRALAAIEFNKPRR